MRPGVLRIRNERIRLFVFDLKLHGMQGNKSLRTRKPYHFIFAPPPEFQIQTMCERGEPVNVHAYL
jgi:hypothetical protein